MPRIAKVVVELSLGREFDYLVPEALQKELRVGSRVVVPFGRREVRGYVVGFAEDSDVGELKEIDSLAGEGTVVPEKLIQLARWMAEYYLAPVEQALKAVLPAAVRRHGARYRRRLFVTTTVAAADEIAVTSLRKRARRQARVLDVLRERGGMFLSELAKAAGTTTATVRSLERKGFVSIGSRRDRRDPLTSRVYLPTQPLPLMDQQKEALASIEKAMDAGRPDVLLLFGVTGSGKTEVYLQAIDHALALGRGAIVLVPEISLTPQTVERFLGRFGEKIAVLHSRLSDGERHDEWYRIREGRARIVIGARSAVFAPVEKLGLIVVDEEHETTYKQEEAPRYNARDVAVVRGRLERCVVVLGSATPSLESFYNARRGKYRLIRLPHRVDHRRMPSVHVVDMRIEAQRSGKVHLLSRDLVEAIRARLERAEQVMLFLNRRGYSTSLICPKCGYVARCGSCSVALTFHRDTQLLCCHICGFRQPVPERCPNPECGDPAFRYAGMGTQKVENVVRRIFPRASVQRMDSDSTTRKKAHQEILGDFRSGKIDILIGTQMIAKGLHFPNVTLVGVIYADLTLHMPDFRSAERTFQLLTQVAGRAGRGDVAGEVIVQTYTPYSPAIQAARRMDYDAFFDQEVEFRHELQYPPATRMLCINMAGKVEEAVSFSAEKFMGVLRPELSSEVIVSGPAPAPIARARGFYRYQIFLRCRRPAAMTVPLRKVLADFKWPKGISCSVDMDPQSLL